MLTVAPPAGGRKRGPNPAPLTAEQRELAADPAALAAAERIARGYARRSPGWVHDDLFSAAFYGVLCAARGFDPARGVPFAGYAAHRIRGSIRDALRALPDYAASLDTCGRDGDGIAGAIPADRDARPHPMA